mgnify:CR=1 FL=1
MPWHSMGFCDGEFVPYSDYRTEEEALAMEKAEIEKFLGKDCKTSGSIERYQPIVGKESKRLYRRRIQGILQKCLP